MLSAAEVIDGTAHAMRQVGAPVGVGVGEVPAIGEQLVELEVDAEDAENRLVAQAPAGEIVGSADGSPETEPGQQLPGTVE